MRPFESSEEAFKAGIKEGTDLFAKSKTLVVDSVPNGGFDGPSGKLPTIYLNFEEEAFDSNHNDFKQDACSMRARLLLIGNRHNRSIIVPDKMEWIGFNVMERDQTLAALLPLIQVK